MIWWYKWSPNWAGTPAPGPAPREGAPPRFIIVKFLSYKTKEEILRTAWQKKDYIWKNKEINLDNDYTSVKCTEEKDKSTQKPREFWRKMGFVFRHPSLPDFECFTRMGPALSTWLRKQQRRWRRGGYRLQFLHNLRHCWSRSGNCHGRSAADGDKHRAVNNEGQHSEKNYGDSRPRKYC